MIKKESFFISSIVFSVISTICFLLGLYYCNNITSSDTGISAFLTGMAYSILTYGMAILAVIFGVLSGLFSVLNFKKRETKVLFLTILTAVCFTIQTIIYIYIKTRNSSFYDLAKSMYFTFFEAIMIIIVMVAGTFGIILSAKGLQKQDSQALYTATLATTSSLATITLVWIITLYFQKTF